MFKKIMSTLLITSILFTFSGCSAFLRETVNTLAGNTPSESPLQESDTEWAMYWYLCGSDLESDYGFATSDLEELMAVPLPENITVVIQTGGADEWQNDFVRADRIQRFVYDHDGLRLVDEQPQANMGDAQTLTSFLDFASKNFPAQRTLVNFWNHGGATMGGIAYDEVYDFDSLDLDELDTAFSTVYERNPASPAIDIVSFDACLMATLDVASALQDFAHYLVASEELMPGNGFYYTGLFGGLVKNPSMDALTFSRLICDTYYEGCEMVDTQSDATLSVVNLSKLTPLLVAYENFGREALAVSIEDPSFFTDFSKIALESENYGGNTRSQGYYNMVDLGHLARKSTELMPHTSDDVLAALDNCIEYKVNGPYRSESTGLSCYYSYDGDLREFTDYTHFGISEAFKHLYYYGLTGDLRPEGIAYVSDLDVEGEDFSDFEASDLAEIPSLASVDYENAPVSVAENGHTVMELGPDASNILTSVALRLYHLDVEQDIVVGLGSSTNLTANWDTGVFQDNFEGVWGSIDGVLCYMDISYESDDYNMYSVPILLNGVKHSLSVVYDVSDNTYLIEGARLVNEMDNHLGERSLVQLQEGDEIQPIQFISTVFGERGELEETTTSTITVTENTQFYETDLPNGTYVMMYEMRDSQGNTALSSPVTLETSGEAILANVA